MYSSITMRVKAVAKIDSDIARLKARLKRLRAERKLAVVLEEEREVRRKEKKR